MRRRSVTNDASWVFPPGYRKGVSVMGMTVTLSELRHFGQRPHFSRPSRYSSAGWRDSQLVRLSAPEGIMPPCTGLLMIS